MIPYVRLAALLVSVTAVFSGGAFVGWKMSAAKSALELKRSGDKLSECKGDVSRLERESDGLERAIQERNLALAEYRGLAERALSTSREALAAQRANATAAANAAASIAQIRTQLAAAPARAAGTPESCSALESVVGAARAALEKAK